MYRESPYIVENEAYIFGDQNKYVDQRAIEEIEYSMNQMSITPAKFNSRKKPINNDIKSFLNLFNQQTRLVQNQQKMEQIFYCRVCSAECTTMCETSRNCASCSQWVCLKCNCVCDKCNQTVCKFCTTISYQPHGDYLLCEQCNS